MFVTFYAHCRNDFCFHGNMEVEDSPIRGMSDVEYLELYIKAHLIEEDLDVEYVTLTGWKRWDA